MTEPKIVIEGVVLSEAQAMTVRVALDAFHDRHQSGALGDDHHGQAMSSAYAKRSEEVLNLIHQADSQSVIREHRSGSDITPIDQAICSLLVAPIQTLGMNISVVIALVLFYQNSPWWRAAFISSMIFGAFLYRATPSIVEATKKRAKARHRNRFPY